MVLHTGSDEPACAFDLVFSVVADPGLTQNLTPIPTCEFLVPETVLGVGTIFALLVIERMCRGSQCHDGPTGVGIIDNMLHLLIREFTETDKKHHQVGRLKSLQAGDVIKRFRIDLTGLFVDRKKHRTLEPVMFRQDFGQMGH
ncbi:hypothetical protein ES703_76524 [subsurface metagenome]